LFLWGDDATVVRHGVRNRVVFMTRPSLAARVAALEEKVGNKTIQEQFREQAELIDQRFLLVDQRLDGIATDVRVLKTDVSALKTDVNALKKEMTIVREGVGIILKKLG